MFDREFFVFAAVAGFCGLLGEHVAQYCALHLFPDLRHFGTLAARKEALRQASLQPGISWRRFGLGSGLLVVYVLCALVVVRTTRPQFGEAHVLVRASLWGLAGVVVGLGRAWFLRHALTRYLRLGLNADGHQLCVTCGYDVRASETRCPECGSLLEEGRKLQAGASQD
ncbi:MAG TPA: hypothetical protein PKK06_01725 [Phycisphaerae bacterium]|nr:hypothetical protein [Phycisphaerae bacterium]HNU44157.1 hypothetical protein [Phycisphaerae bacterium]